MRIGSVTLALLGLIAYLHSASAQDWPNRPITMVVPFAAGGAGDILSRMLGPRLQQKWGQG